MQKFSHHYAKAVREIWVHAPQGAWIRDTLIVTVNIPLDSSDPSFDPKKIADLETAVDFYLVAHPCRSYVFEQG